MQVEEPEFHLMPLKSTASQLPGSAPSTNHAVTRDAVVCDPAIFDDDDWHSLRDREKTALLVLSKGSAHFDKLENALGVAMKSVDALVSKGLAIEDISPLGGAECKITEKGWLAVEWINGRRTRLPPRR